MHVKFNPIVAPLCLSQTKKKGDGIRAYMFMHQLDGPLEFAIVAAHPTSHIRPQLQPLAALEHLSKIKRIA
jgi:hypothetical protein